MKHLPAAAILFALLVPCVAHAQPIAHLPAPEKPFPRTLIAGTFRIEVERYDIHVIAGPWSGIGRVRFSCLPIFPPFPW